MLCASSIKEIEDTMHHEWNVKSCLEKFVENGLYFRNAVAVELLEELMKYQVVCASDSSLNYVDGKVLRLAELDVWNKL